jgi:hypothetical protein
MSDKIFCINIHYTENVQYWDNAKNQRRLFDRIAEANLFDPLVPENWYSLSPKKFLAFRVSSYFDFFTQISDFFL